MDLNKLEKITMSLMVAENEPDDLNKTKYVVKATATVVVKESVVKAIEQYGLKSVLNVIYDDILEKCKDPVDSIGLWVNYDNKEYENSIKLSTLNDIKQYGSNDIDAIYEFFRMTVKEPALATEDGEIDSVV